MIFLTSNQASGDSKRLKTYPQQGSSGKRQGLLVFQQPWAISPAIIANATTRMKLLDPQATGGILKCSFVKFYANIFSIVDLAKIWNLVDILKEGSISQDEFAVALFFLHRTSVGLPLPQKLSIALIPPSIRSHPQFQFFSYGPDLDNEETWDLKAERPIDWTINESIQLHGASIFKAKDTQNVGYIRQEVVTAFVRRFCLGDRDTNQIYKLLGLKTTRHITLHIFTLTLFFIHWTLAGQDLPQTFPESLKTALRPISPSTTHPNRLDEPIPSSRSAIRNYRDSIRVLTIENERLKEQRSALTTTTTDDETVRRAVRPLPIPSSPQSQTPSELSVGSEDTSPSISSPAPFDDLREEVDQLRAMIERLMVENEALRGSVREIQVERGIEGIQNVALGVEDLPPPYEEAF